MQRVHPEPVVYRHQIHSFTYSIVCFICFCSVVNALCVSAWCYCQSLAQQALMGTINSSMQAVQQAQADLGNVDNLPPLGHDLVNLPFY